MRPLRVLVVDDSALNRRTLADLLSQMPGVTVAGVAQDGDEALRLAAQLAPDLITLDLEMPRMDGFTFLRLLMATRPTPVLVVSSHSAKENVFRALELGAIDFIAKPDSFITSHAESVRQQLDSMVAMVRQLAPAKNLRRSVAPRPRESHRPPQAAAQRGGAPDAGGGKRRPPSRLMVIASSTGGPTALLDLFSQLPAQSDACVVVAQHMPERFTRAFAERLDRMSSFSVKEASDGDSLYAEQAVVCPGGKCVEVDFLNGRVLLHVVEPDARDRYTPSGDRLFRSAARALGERVIGVVLTGMGEDGARGVIDIKNAAGTVFVESEETAVVYGMPRCANATGAVDEVLPLPGLVTRLSGLIARSADAASNENRGGHT
ncbi:MAG: chemotaxis-specific protein-glutamate methyltransferase CheB [Polyangiales bacterium]